MIDETIEREARRRVNRRMRRFMLYRVLPVVAFMIWAWVVFHATITYSFAPDIVEYSPELKMFVTVLILPYLAFVGYLEWRQRAVAREAERVRAELAAQTPAERRASGLAGDAPRKAKGDPAARLALDDEADPLEDVLWQNENKPKRSSDEE